MIRENRVANRDMARDTLTKAELAPVAEGSGHMSLWMEGKSFAGKEPSRFEALRDIWKPDLERRTGHKNLFLESFYQVLRDIFRR